MTALAGQTVVAQGSPPDTVFDVSPALAIEAARTRLRLFVDDNPESGGVAGGCPRSAR